MNILIVDDHPMTVEGYAKAIEKGFTNCNIIVAYDCKQAYEEIAKTKVGQDFDIVLIDQGLPEYAEQKLYSGIDVALLLRNTTPNCRIVMITAHTEHLIIYDIHKKLCLKGWLIRENLLPQSL